MLRIIITVIAAALTCASCLDFCGITSTDNILMAQDSRIRPMVREFQQAAPCRVVSIGANEMIWTCVREECEVKSRPLAFIQLLLAGSLDPDLALP